MSNKEYIYRVKFNHEPPFADKGDYRKDFFFTSISAIYDMFTPEQIGCGLRRLWNTGLGKGNTYAGRLTTITREPITSKNRETKEERL